MNAEQKAYFKKLKERYQYFQSKPITELEKKEIDEYLMIMKEIQELMQPIIDTCHKVMYEVIIPTLTSAFDLVRNTPEFKAEMRYQERILGSKIRRNERSNN